jgi:hypothetical protein
MFQLVYSLHKSHRSQLSQRNHLNVARRRLDLNLVSLSAKAKQKFVPNL